MKLHGTRHQVIPDRIEAGTYISLAAAVGKGIRINNVPYEHSRRVYRQTRGNGRSYAGLFEDSISLKNSPIWRAINIKTALILGLQLTVTVYHATLLTAQGREPLLIRFMRNVSTIPFELAKWMQILRLRMITLSTTWS